MPDQTCIYFVDIWVDIRRTKLSENATFSRSSVCLSIVWKCLVMKCFPSVFWWHFEYFILYYFSDIEFESSIRTKYWNPELIHFTSWKVNSQFILICRQNLLKVRSLQHIRGKAIQEYLPLFQTILVPGLMKISCSQEKRALVSFL